MKWRIGRSSSGSGNSNQSGGGCLIIFGLVFGGIGLAAFFAFGKVALDEAATYQWTETLCTIESCEIEDDASNDEPFEMIVRYGYDFGGRNFTSTQYTLQNAGVRNDTYEDLALHRKALLSDGVVCFVDPENPANAVLKREGVTTGLVALIPLLFVAVGGLIIWGGIHSLRKKKAVTAAGGVESISAEATAKKVSGWKVGVVFGAIFFLVGAGLSYPLAIKPISKMISSKHWMETPCKVLWSKVRRHESTDDDGHTSITYSVDIFYEYEVNGETHRSNNYGFFGGSSSGRAGKKKIVDRYSRGSEKKCYVNPELPEQAVLNPEFSAMAFLGLIPILFGGIGLFVLIASIRSRKKAHGGTGIPGNQLKSPSTTAALRSGDGTSRADSGPRILKPAGSRLAKTFGMLFLALFWNGIVSVFVYQVIQGFQRGKPEWFLTIFMIPFVLVGLGLLIAFFYQLLALANPKPVLTVNPGTVRLGEPFEVRWKLSGSASRVSSLTLSLWGIESATYQRGTNTHTSNSTFYADDFAAVSRLIEVQSGSATLTIPANLVPSFETDNNEIKYELRVAGDIPYWPDIGDHYEISVLPSAAS